jgi:hypothetical protein
VTRHRDGCTFGSGFYRVELTNGDRRFCQSDAEVVLLTRILAHESIKRVQRDGYCLDQYDGSTPDVIQAETFLGMPREEAMRTLGFDNEADYARAYRAVEDAVLARDRAQSDGDKPSIVVKKRGAQHVTNV